MKSGRRCPNREIWCGYLDGSVSGKEKSWLANHLNDCDTCFSKVASIQAALTLTEDESALIRTPQELLEKGSGMAIRRAWKPTALTGIAAWLIENSRKLMQQAVPNPAFRIVSYAAAACLVLGIAFWASREFFFLRTPIPSARRMYVALYDALEADGRSLPADLDDAMGRQGFTLYGFSEVRSAEARIFRVGTLLAQLQMAFDYSGTHLGNTLKTINLMKDELAALEAPEAPSQVLDALGSKIRSGGHSREEMDFTLADFHRCVVGVVEKRGKPAETYLRAGEWVEGLWITAWVVKTTGGVTKSNQILLQQPNAGEYVLGFFGKRDVPRGMIQSLEQLLWLSKKVGLTDRDVDTILSETENLRRLLS